MRLSAERGELQSASCTGWTPNYLVKNKYVTNDAQLVAYPQSKNARCFISGLSGAWSSTRAGGTLQPYAQIYVGPTGDLRMRVSPSDLGMPVDRVGANASCIQVK